MTAQESIRQTALTALHRTDMTYRLSNREYLLTTVAVITAAEMGEGTAQSNADSSRHEFCRILTQTGLI